jgi:hypothetical protein
MSTYPPPQRNRRAERRPVLSAVRRIFNGVEIGLWVVVVLFGMGAILLLQRAPANRLAAKHQLAEEVLQENQNFCQSRGFEPGSAAYVSCAMGLNELRAAHEKRLGLDPFGL